MIKPMTIEVARALLDVSEALRFRLLDENKALLARPSPVFHPQSKTDEGRQLEREAFAKGLHHAALSLPRKDCHA